MYKRSLYTVNNAGQRPKRYLRYRLLISSLKTAYCTAMFRFIIRKRNKYRSEQSCSVYNNVMCVKCQVKFYVHSTSKDDINNKNSKQYLSFMCCPRIVLPRNMPQQIDLLAFIWIFTIHFQCLLARNNAVRKRLLWMCLRSKRS